MPYIDTDIEVDEFLSACNKRDIKEIIEALVEDGHLPENVLKNDKEKNSKKTSNEIDFEDKLDQLKGKYFSISQEDEDILSSIFKKYL